MGEQGGLQPGQWEGKYILEAESETSFSPACLAITSTGWASNTAAHTHQHKHTQAPCCTSTVPNKVSLRIYVSDFYKRDL